MNIKIIEDLKLDPYGMLKEICGFLGVDESFEFKSQARANESYIPRMKLLSRFVTVESRTKFRILNQLPENWRSGIRNQFDQWNKSRKSNIVLQPNTRAMLQDLYKHDVLRLQTLIRRDLSAWLNP